MLRQTQGTVGKVLPLLTMSSRRGIRGLCLLSSSATTSKKHNFFALSEEELAAVVLPFPVYRGRQLQRWVYSSGVTDFSLMNNLPSELRENLRQNMRMGALETAYEEVSKDGTVKIAYQLDDGQLIESVLMPYNDGRRTACISSQAGCAMACSFCATGQMGFGRQLSATEIFEQAAKFAIRLRQRNERLSNIVFMGMGEPLNNYKNVMQAISRIRNELGIGSRHITVSTVGIVPRIKKLADEGLQVGLAVSLHHASDEKRSALMPVNDKYPLTDLIEACRYFIKKTNRRISFEWALIDGNTDGESEAHELGILIKDLHCHVNLIPLNSTDQFSGNPSSKKRAESFISILKKRYGISATMRVRRGLDIQAGCGQLKSAIERKRSTKSAKNIQD